MAKNRSEKSKYPSRYSPQGWVHAAQYIAELICEKKAKINNKELCLKFWELKEWNKFLVWQIGLANKLLKKYSEKSIIKALRDDYRCKNTFSLNSPVFLQVIQEYEKAESVKQKPKDPTKKDYSLKTKFRESNSKNILDKLQELDDKE